MAFYILPLLTACVILGGCADSGDSLTPDDPSKAPQEAHTTHPGHLPSNWDKPKI